MRTRILVCLLALSLAPQLSFASEASPLGDRMEAIGDAFKPLYRGLMAGPDSDQIEQYLAWTRTIKAEATKAREHAPAMTAEMSEVDRTAMVKDYTADMDTFVKKVEALEKALVAGNLTQAQVLVKGLKAARNDAHGKYQEEEEE